MKFPDDLYYTEDHEWVRVDGSTGTIGITDFAQSELGDIVYIEVDSEGESLDQDDVFGTVEAVKTVSELFMPVSGTVTGMNENLEDEPELVNDDPYEDGWIITVEIADADEIDDLMSASEYADMVGQ